MNYTFVRDWSGYDTLTIEADSLEDAEEILNDASYNSKDVEASSSEPVGDWEIKNEL